MSKNALIFGVSGQDGAYLAQLLLGKGYTVFGTSRDAQISSFSNLCALGVRERVQTLSANPVDFRSVLNAIHRTQPEEIYNLAGQSSVVLSFDQPMDTFSSISIANLTLLEAIRFLGKKIRYYNAGSSECFGNTLEPATETTPFQPRSPYAVGKAAAFWQVANYREAYNLYACSGILFNHESSLRSERFVTQKIVRAACRITQGSDEILQLGNMNDEPGDYIIAPGHTYSLCEFTEAVFSTLRWTGKIMCAIMPHCFARPISSRAGPSLEKRLKSWAGIYDPL